MDCTRGGATGVEKLALAVNREHIGRLADLDEQLCRAAQRGEDVRIAEEELAEMLADEAEEDADGEAEENAVAAAVGDEVAPLEPAVALVQRVSSSQVAKTHATLMRTVAALGAAQEIIFLGEEALGAVARGGG